MSPEPTPVIAVIESQLSDFGLTRCAPPTNSATAPSW